MSTRHPTLKEQMDGQFPDLMKRAVTCRFNHPDCHGPLKPATWNGQTFQACAACRRWLNKFRSMMMPSPEV